MSMTWLPLLFFLQIDFSLAVFFVVYFFIRFLAADDKLMFLVTVETLVDFFTVPSVFLSGNFRHNCKKSCFKKSRNLTLYQTWDFLTLIQVHWGFQKCKFYQHRIHPVDAILLPKQPTYRLGSRLRGQKFSVDGVCLIKKSRRVLLLELKN